MQVNRDMLNDLIDEYGISKGKPDGRTRSRLAIILGEFLIKSGMPARDAAIMERVFFDELAGFELISGQTGYEAYLESAKEAYKIDALKIGLPEGTAYSEDAREKAYQIILYIQGRVKDGGSKRDQENTIGGTVNERAGIQKAGRGRHALGRASLSRGDNEKTLVL